MDTDAKDMQKCKKSNIELMQTCLEHKYGNYQSQMDNPLSNLVKYCKAFYEEYRKADSISINPDVQKNFMKLLAKVLRVSNPRIDKKYILKSFQYDAILNLRLSHYLKSIRR